MTPARLLTIPEAAEALGVCEDTFRVIVRQGGIPRIQLSARVVRFDPADIAAYQAGGIVPWSQRAFPEPPPSDNLRSIQGSVYFLLSGKTNVKIGFTKDSDSQIATRIRQLQTGNPNVLKLITKVPGSRADEKLLHRKFRVYQTRAEWFAWTGELKEYVEGVKASGALGGLE